MMRPINANYGIIREVSDDKTTITIRLPKGGSIKCKNEGFEVGDVVCFILNSLGNRVIKVLPKDIADLQALMGSHELLFEALRIHEEPTMPEIPDDNIIDIDITESLEKEGDYENDDDADQGPIFEKYIDIISSEIGGDDIEWEIDV